MVDINFVECGDTRDHEEVFEKPQIYKLIDKHVSSIMLVDNQLSCSHENQCG